MVPIPSLEHETVSGLGDWRPGFNRLFGSGPGDSEWDDKHLGAAYLIIRPHEGLMGPGGHLIDSAPLPVENTGPPLSLPENAFNAAPIFPPAV